MQSAWARAVQGQGQGIESCFYGFGVGRCLGADSRESFGAWACLASVGKGRGRAWARALVRALVRGDCKICKKFAKMARFCATICADR